MFTADFIASLVCGQCLQSENFCYMSIWKL